MMITKMREDEAAEQLGVRVDGEGDEVDRHGVQHQLDGHEDLHRVAPREHAVDAEREEDALRRRGSSPAVSARRQSPPTPPPLPACAMTMAPIERHEQHDGGDLEGQQPVAEEGAAEGVDADQS